MSTNVCHYETTLHTPASKFNKLVTNLLNLITPRRAEPNASHAHESICSPNN